MSYPYNNERLYPEELLRKGCSMQDKATPRPWKINENCLDAKEEGYIRIGTDKDKWLCETKGTHVGSKVLGEALANASLIVRAVNAHDALVEACKTALDVLENDCTIDGQETERCKLLQHALALAEGKQ